MAEHLARCVSGNYGTAIPIVERLIKNAGKRHGDARHHALT